eukprot:TRINITY_DN8591_c0_g1_i2.p1 TRINITY_DN8591_c0_g1~~TRINITY_DN8591_c0_g1_i2.p1  ORF type:complete len:134 (+),score=12.14 TRINITY_DN8591_c0_g1_i2:174-575(+)
MFHIESLQWKTITSFTAAYTHCPTVSTSANRSASHHAKYLSSSFASSFLSSSGRDSISPASSLYHSNVCFVAFTPSAIIGSSISKVTVSANPVDPLPDVSLWCQNAETVTCRLRSKPFQSAPAKKIFWKPFFT